MGEMAGAPAAAKILAPGIPEIEGFSTRQAEGLGHLVQGLVLCLGRAPLEDGIIDSVRLTQLPNLLHHASTSR